MQSVRKFSLEVQAAPIKGVLCNDDLAVAAGLFARGTSPVFALCRVLIDYGFDRDLQLDLYRDDELCLSIHGIGTAAELEINAHGTGFRKRPQQGGTASLVDFAPVGHRAARAQP
jgi:hypothetical protein